MAASANRANSALSIFSYHVGRLVVYVALEGLAGTFGNSLNRLGILAGINGTAPIFTGVLLVWWGFLALRRGTLPSPRGALWKRLVSILKTNSPVAPFLIGASSAFLPYGWLYVFVATSATFGSPALGMLAMAAFWLGTVPALTALGVAARETIRLGGILPKIAALLIIFAGFFSIGAHLQHSEAQISQPPICHASK